MASSGALAFDQQKAAHQAFDLHELWFGTTSLIGASTCGMVSTGTSVCIGYLPNDWSRQDDSTITISIGLRRLSSASLACPFTSIR